MAYRGCDLILSCHEAETDHAKWLETRNAGIGGSDASVIMGLNPYKSPYQLWMGKTGQADARTSITMIDDLADSLAFFVIKMKREEE